MWSKYYSNSMTQLIQASLIKLCSENIPFENKLDIDGIICISTGDETKQLVVKVHETLSNSGSPLHDDTHSSTGARHPLLPCYAKAITPSKTLSSAEVFENDEVSGGKMVPTSEFIDLERYNALLKDGNSHGIKEEVNSRTDISTRVSRRKAKAVKLESHPVVYMDVELEDNEYQMKNTPAESSLNFPQTIFKKSATPIIPNKDYRSPTRKKTLSESLQNLEALNSAVNNNLDANKSFQRVPLAHELSPIKASEHLPCKMCTAKFSTFPSLQHHNLDQHCRHTCKFCYNTFSMRCNLRRHERLHAGIKPYNCSKCHKCFARSTDLKLHMDKHKKTLDETKAPSVQTATIPNVNHVSHKKSFRLSKVADIIKRCKVCNLSFITEQKLKKHLVENHPKDSCFEEKAYTCMECNENFVNETEYEQHRSTHTSVTSQKECDVKAAGNETPLLDFGLDLSRNGSHSNISRDSTPNEDIKMENLKIVSVVSHSIEKSSSDILVGELETTDIKPVANESLLKVPVHYSSATPPSLDNSRSCSPVRVAATGEAMKKCVTSSATKRSGRMPMEVYGEKELDTVNKEYHCDICNTMWLGFMSYDEHIVSSHMRYPCGYCKHTFTNKNNRNRHVRAHMGKNKYECEECGKIFTRTDSLREHRFVHTLSYQANKCLTCGVTVQTKSDMLSHLKRCTHPKQTVKDMNKPPSMIMLNEMPFFEKSATSPAMDDNFNIQMNIDNNNIPLSLEKESASGIDA